MQEEKEMETVIIFSLNVLLVFFLKVQFYYMQLTLTTMFGIVKFYKLYSCQRLISEIGRQSFIALLFAAIF